jgi:hypothetical protein
MYEMAGIFGITLTEMMDGFLFPGFRDIIVTLTTTSSKLFDE